MSLGTDTNWQARASITPYARLTYAHSTTDGYSETELTGHGPGHALQRCQPQFADRNPGAARRHDAKL